MATQHTDVEGKGWEFDVDVYDGGSALLELEYPDIGLRVRVPMSDETRLKLIDALAH